MRPHAPYVLGRVPVWRMRHVLLGLLASSLSLGTVCLGESPSTLIQHEPQPLARIAPGWEIAAEPAAPWTHLVIFSRPRLAEGESNKVYPLVARLATLLSTTIVAEVGTDAEVSPPVYTLKQVAVGLATRVEGRDVIVSSTTQREQRAELGFLGNLLLSQSESRLEQIQQAVRTPTLAIVDAPGIMLRDGQHADILLRYALTVEPRTGTLSTLLWLLEASPDKGWRLIEPTCRLLAPGLVEDCRLHVDSQELTAGVPSARAFAIVTTPPGKALPLPHGMASLAATARFSREQVAQLELALRELVGSVQQGPARVRKEL